MNTKITPYLLAALLLASSLKATYAQTEYSWAQRSSGSNGIVPENAEVIWDWHWSPGDVYITGVLTMTRQFAGETFVGAETMEQTLTAVGASSDFTNPYINSLGGSSALYHFINEGESGRGVDDTEPDVISTTTFTFAFNDGYSAPENTLITLFDPGAYEIHGNGFTYDFRAWSNGQLVDISQWTVRIEDAFIETPANTSTIVWDPLAARLSVDDFAPEGDYPDSIVFLDTGSTRFDRLEVVATGLVQDTFAIGFGANTAAVPEPSGALLLLFAGLIATLRRR